MINYLIIHNKHEGCYDFHCYQDEAARIRLTSITINPPKIYMFKTRDEAQDFFEEYINDVDCIDIRCKRGDDVEHIDYCTCGVIELDDKGEPILFYNKKNQIFLLEQSPQLFMPNQDVKNDIRNLNLTNRLIRKCKSLGREQRKRYIELGKYCEECNLGGGGDLASDSSDDDESDKPTKKQRDTSSGENVVLSGPIPIPMTLPPVPTNPIHLPPAPASYSSVHVMSSSKPATATATEEEQKPKAGRKKKQVDPDAPKTPKAPRKKKGETPTN
jgi:hypothetical protein